MYKWSRSHDQDGHHGYKWHFSLNLLLQNQKAYDFESWLEASGRGALQIYINHDPGMTLTYFMARPCHKLRLPVHLNEKKSMKTC